MDLPSPWIVNLGEHDTGPFIQKMCRSWHNVNQPQFQQVHDGSGCRCLELIDHAPQSCQD